MKRKKVWITVASGAFMLLAVAVATAASSPSSTPLYTYRMEQTSYEMNFLPTEVSSFTYAAENGYTLNYDVPMYCGSVTPLMTEGSTCNPTCDIKTCISCLTCDTCFHCVTVDPTCDENTCQYTCGGTCDYTCSGWTCDPPC